MSAVLEVPVEEEVPEEEKVPRVVPADPYGEPEVPEEGPPEGSEDEVEEPEVEDVPRFPAHVA